MKTAVFPGSFDPITIGHVDIIKRALPLFDKIIIGIGNNTSKQYMFELAKREVWIKKVFEENKSVEVKSYNGLTVDFCRQNNASYIIRGLRNASDFQFEQSIAQMNHALNNEIETVFIPCNPSFSAINSTVIRDIHKNGGSITQFVPGSVVL